MKRALTWVGIVVAVLAVVIGGLWFTIFGPNSPIADGPIADGVVSVKESYASAYIVYLARGVLFFGDSAGASKKGEMMKAVSLTSKNPVENVASLKGLEKRLETRKADVKALAFGHTGPLQGFDPLAAFARAN